MKNILTVTLIFLLSGCGADYRNDTPVDDFSDTKTETKREAETQAETEKEEKGKVSLSDLKLQKYQSCSDMKTYVIKSLIKRYTEFNYYLKDFLGSDVVTTGAETRDSTPSGDMITLSVSSTSEGSSSTPTGVSETNNQEVGVDEPDIVKTDSKGNIYVIHGTKLIISSGFPPSEMKTVSTVELESYLNVIHLDEQNNRLVISGNYYRNRVQTGIVAPELSGYGIRVVFLDVRDLENPAIEKEIFIEGREIGSRRVENRIHLVSSFQKELPDSLMKNNTFRDLLQQYRELERGGSAGTLPESGSLSGQEVLVTRQSAPVETKRESILKTLKIMIADAVNNSDIQEFFPKVFEKVNGSWNKTSSLSCSDIFSPKVSMTPGLLVVSSFDTDGQNMRSAAIINNAWRIYSSKENLYVFQSSRGWWFNNSQKSQSAVYRFKISDQAPRYSSAGTFSGWINDQFSVSEYDGYLRVVTTSRDIEEDTGLSRSVNNLFVLKETDTGELAISGKITGLAPGERVYSARFLGDRGFVVTFRNIDPLLSFDLSDPENPILTGELKIPGFSTYMHPLSDSHLLTIGREANMLKLQIFDVSDLSAPKLIHKEVPDANDLSGKYVYTYSSAAYDHHALTYYAPEKILVFPYSYSWHTESNGYRHFNGFLSYRVSVENGFEETGRVDHSDLARQKYCISDLTGGVKTTSICKDQSYIYYGNPRRSIIMTTETDTYLYSLSNVGLKVTPIGSPENVLGSIIFPDQRYGWWWGAY